MIKQLAILATLTLAIASHNSTLAAAKSYSSILLHSGNSTFLNTPCTFYCQATVPANALVGEDVLFVGTASSENCYGEPSYAWVYGDGNTGVGPTTTHAYCCAGTYNWFVTVTASDQTCKRVGSLTVTEPQRLPGDCNGDGQVSIGEVQKSINMFMGLLQPACGVNCSYDGVVTISEVQKVINGFLGLNSTC